MKTCITCKKTKDESEFKWRKDLNKYTGQCTSCLKERKGSGKRRKEENEELLKIGRKRCFRCEEVKTISEYNKGRAGEYLAICKDCRSKRAKTPKYFMYNKKNKIMNSYGATDDEYRHFLSLTKCECCGKEFSEENDRERKCCDHSHESKKYRGALCMACNLGIGYFYDDPELLSMAIRYLKER